MKKVLALILAAVMVISLTACGGNTGATAANNAADSSTTAPEPVIAESVDLAESTTSSGKLAGGMTSAEHPEITAEGKSQDITVTISQYVDIAGIDAFAAAQAGRNDIRYNMVFHLDFGNSYSYGTSVMGDLLSRFPYTVLIALISVILSVIVGIPLGVSCAVRANTIYDRLSMVLSLVFASIPGFWLALMLIQLLSVKLGILPAFGFESWNCYILPCTANAMAAVAMLARQTRASMLEVIRADYVTTARAKGIANLRVLYRHALPTSGFLICNKSRLAMHESGFL